MRATIADTIRLGQLPLVPIPNSSSPLEDSVQVMIQLLLEYALSIISSLMFDWTMNDCKRVLVILKDLHDTHATNIIG